MIADLYTAYAAELRAYAVLRGATPEDAEDAVQNAFVSMLIGGYREQGLARAWLYKVVQCRLIDAARTDRRHPVSYIQEVFEPSHDPIGGALARIELEDVLSRLPSAQRAAITLRHVDGLLPAEIAERMNCTVGAAKALCHRARVNLTT